MEESRDCVCERGVGEIITPPLLLPVTRSDLAITGDQKNVGSFGYVSAMFQ